MTTNELKPVPDTIQQSRFLKACRREQVDATPVWLMRQAGRYMTEYRELRKTYDILELIKSPALACEVTMQPIKAFDLDAAIIFADILPPLEGMGLKLEFVKGEGPLIHNPIASAADVDALHQPDPRYSQAYTLEAIRLTRAELDPRGVPLIGFSGAPFTLASYAIEGGSSKNFVKTKSMMLGEPAVWARLMEKLSELVGEYLKAQAEAGAVALQVFDSWAGALSPRDYREFVLPWSRRAIEIASEAGVPVIHFGTDTAGIIELIRDAGGDVIGVDWRMDLDDAWRRLGDGVAVQGNLDPVALFAPWDNLRSCAQTVLEQAANRPGHIFNLGHGILPQPPVDNVRRLVDFVHEHSRRA
ncbi:MAG: uroporphyrinogen decarboxylase [Candidatus Hydrogenedentes bacterium]|nr:uroporphyrinogen decarboxylase [Candidatus Hydrogenedentota bacterium]